MGSRTPLKKSMGSAEPIEPMLTAPLSEQQQGKLIEVEKKLGSFLQSYEPSNLKLTVCEYLSRAFIFFALVFLVQLYFEVDYVSSATNYCVITVCT